ncbi:HD-GYP domain-containing protein [Legionella septentrionalis]|uniref:HD-GYP domain-containing protein n=1 Tax=Legionella septentrionalis TaxID=2498109 RepID=UPI000F8CD0D5|nr:HD-GYP domain-containing protein [Legionella septentrionalis]RUR11267.1 HD-GYP domain-containing protein [Legionella septentrionalis]
MKFSDREEEKIITVMFQILGELSNPTLVCDKNGTILFANKAYQKLTNSEPENKIFWRLCPIYKKSPDYFNQAREQNTETRAELKFHDKTFIIRVIPINNVWANGSIYIIYLEDITLQAELTKQLTNDKKLLQQSFLNTILAFSNFIESRDPYTSGHQKRVATLSLNIAIKAKITAPEYLYAIYYGALIHDIGKIGIPMEYLVTPRKLTTYEYAIIKAHVEIGYKILININFPWEIKPVVYQHHERMDGSGYPNHLKGSQISIPARIVAIADVYEAMSTHRPYREALPQADVVNYLKKHRGDLFDPYYIDSFFQCLADTENVYLMNSDFKLF